MRREPKPNGLSERPDERMDAPPGLRPKLLDKAAPNRPASHPQQRRTNGHLKGKALPKSCRTLYRKVPTPVAQMMPIRSRIQCQIFEFIKVDTRKLCHPRPSTRLRRKPAHTSCNAASLDQVYTTTSIATRHNLPQQHVQCGQPRLRDAQNTGAMPLEAFAFALVPAWKAAH